MIDEIKEGNAAAFEELYHLNKEKLLAYFLKKTNSIEAAKDLMQTTFFKLWQYRKSLSADYLPEQQLFYIARTVFIDYLRKESKQHKIKTSIKARTDEKQAADYIYSFDAEARLQNVLSEMPQLRRKVFQLHRVEGYSYKEISEMLQIPVKSVDNNLAKALKYLRNAELYLLIFIISTFF